MNSVASVVRASSGRATPKVSPAETLLLGTVHVSNRIPVLGSLYKVGVVDWARHACKTANASYYIDLHQET